MSRARAIAVVLVLTSALSRARCGVPRRRHTSQASYTFDGWRGAEAAALDDETLRILAADDVLNRTYVAGDRTPVGLYVAYYAGSVPASASTRRCIVFRGRLGSPRGGYLELRFPGSPAARCAAWLRAAMYQRALVLYWYQSHGRVIASEFTTKLTQLADSVRLHRSDAAMIRIVVPIGASVQQADERGLAFARDLAPRMIDILK
jgi:hypothetical protein